MATSYLTKLPDPTDRLIILADTMIATGNTATHAIDTLQSLGVKTGNIRMISLICSAFAAERMQRNFADIKIWTGAIDGSGKADNGLDKRNYIVPGLGDSGDRLFGTFLIPNTMEDAEII